VDPNNVDEWTEHICEQTRRAILIFAIGSLVFTGAIAVVYFGDHGWLMLWGAMVAAYLVNPDPWITVMGDIIDALGIS